MQTQKYPFRAVAFTSEPAFHSMPDDKGGERAVWFALDLESLDIPKNPCVVDYNHDSNEPIGSATLTVEGGSLIAKGEFCSAVDGDYASKIAALGGDVPFGISPTLAFTRAVAEEIPEGATGEANGRLYEGPLVIYRGATVLGVSVCPYPTDTNTTVTPLEQDGAIKLNNNNGVFFMESEFETKNPIPVDDKTAEEKLGAASGVQDGTQSPRDPELQSFIDEFGCEKGVAFFQRGLSIDDAMKEDYRELKRLAQEGTAAAQLADETPPEEKPEEEKKASLAAGREFITKLSARISRQEAVLNSIMGMLSNAFPKSGAVDTPKEQTTPAARVRKYADVVCEAAGIYPKRGV